MEYIPVSYTHLLCIARALLKDPKILILDDSTSAVDTATDAKIRKAFAEEIPNTTKLIIAQRISSVMNADRIIVLNNGCLLYTSQEYVHTRFHCNRRTFYIPQVPRCKNVSQRNHAPAVLLPSIPR